MTDQLIVLKKLFAIILLSIYLFNLAGFSLLFQYFITKSDHNVIIQLDNSGYNKADLIEIKVALHLPYITAKSDYERTDGQIQLNKIYYNYVMRKVQNDTLFLLCLPDYNKTKLCDLKLNYSKLANDIPVNKKSSDAGIKKGNNASDYNCSVVQYHLDKPQQQTVSYNNFAATFLPSPVTIAPWQPPQFS